MFRHSFDKHREQIAEIFKSWGMPEDAARKTADVLGWADLRGVESHGIAMIVEYDERRRTRPINFKASPQIVRETPVSALVDADGGLGHAPAAFAMNIAVRKAKEVGVGMVSVRNSGHFGALGYFTSMAVEAGLIGIATTSVFGIRVPPTGGSQARFGTDPWSFAAPGEDGRPFVLDMATTTVASGKVRNKVVEEQKLPVGWGFDKTGRPTLDPAAVMDGGFLAPLGGTPEGASHKGYGLAMMVNILSSCLSGSTLITDPMHSRQPKGLDVGHFFMAFDPGLFRDPAEFRADVQRLCDAMRATPPVEPEKPVLVAGDPERAVMADRTANGIPISAKLTRRLRQIASATDARWVFPDPDSHSETESTI